MKTVIIGSGSWGTALAQTLVDNKEDAVIYGIDVDEIVDIDRYHQNSKYFGDLLLNYDLHATNNPEVIKDADIVVLSVPSGSIGPICQQLNDLIDHQVIIVNTAKGFHPDSHRRLSEVISENLDPTKVSAIVTLIGPSHSEEVVQRMLTTINAVSDNHQAAQKIQQLFSNDYFRVYTSDDVIGSEVGVALKNVIAIASGILAGLEIAGDNAKAALMTRGLAEIVRYGLFKGGKLETFLGLTGIGDLIVTCTSEHSRNYQAGYQIGKFDSAKYFWDNNTKTVEGVMACKVVYQDAQENGLDLPIVQQIYKVLFENGKPSQAIEELMHRELKTEKLAFYLDKQGEKQ